LFAHPFACLFSCANSVQRAKNGGAGGLGGFLVRLTIFACPAICLPGNPEIGTSSESFAKSGRYSEHRVARAIQHQAAAAAAAQRRSYWRRRGGVASRRSVCIDDGRGRIRCGQRHRRPLIQRHNSLIRPRCMFSGQVCLACCFCSGGRRGGWQCESCQGDSRSVAVLWRIVDLHHLCSPLHQQ
jgi:hypothetical protein